MMLRRLTIILPLFFSLGLQAQNAKLILPVGHTGTVMKTRFSPNSRFVLTGSEDGTAKLWDKASGRLLQTYSGHWQGVTDVAFNSDGSLIATASRDSTIGIWETISGKKKLLLNHHAPVDRISFNNTSTELISSSFQGAVTKFWDLKTGDLIENVDNTIDGYYLKDDKWVMFRNYRDAFTCHKENGEVNCFLLGSRFNTIIMLDDKSGFISAGSDSVLHILDMEANHIRKVKMKFGIRSMSISADQKTIVLTSDSSPYAEVRNLADTVLLGKFGENVRYQNRIDASFSPSGNYLFLALEETEAFDIYSVEGRSLNPVMHYPKGFNVVRDVVFSPVGKEFVVATHLNDVDLWSVNSKTPLVSFKGYAYPKQFAQTVMQDSFVVVQSEKTNVELWDNQQHKLIYSLEKEAEKVNAITLSQDETMIASVDNENNLQVWETRSGRLMQQIAIGKVQSEFVQSVPLWVVDERSAEPFVEKGFTKTEYDFDRVFFNHQATLIATTSQETEAIPLWDVKTGKLLTNINIGANGVLDVVFSPDDKKLVAIGRGGAALLFDISTHEIKSMRGHKGTIYCAAFSPSNAAVVTGGNDSTLKIWDAHNGKRLYSTSIGGVVKKIIFAPDESKIVVATGKYVGIFDVNNMNAPRWINPRDLNVREIFFFHNSSSDLLITFDDAGPLKVNTKTMVFENYEKVGGADHVSISHDNRLLIASQANRISKYDAKDGKLISSFFTVGDAGFFSDIPGNFYRCSPDASKLLHYVTPDLKVIGFDQLDIRYNRPDKVLEAIGCRDTALIKSYKRAYLKRIRKLGIDTTQFKAGYSIPESDFQNRDRMAYDQTTSQLTLRIHATDSIYRLDRFNIWVNEVPVFGMKGLKFKGRPRKTFDTTLVVTLAQGENSIETSVINSNSTESYRKPLLVKYSPKVLKQPQVYFVGIGINTFADATRNLNWSVKDIRDLALKLKKKYPLIIIDTLFDRRVTRQNILNLKPKLQSLKEDDIVIVSYSGHGMLSKDLDYFLSTYNVDFNQPAINGLAYDELESLLDNIKPRKKLMLIDACHSGEIDKDDIVRIKSSERSLASLGTHTKGVEVLIEQKVGLENSFELMQSLFLNVSRGTGATIISAAGGMQFAQERGDLKNGVFTYSIIDALNKNSTLTVSQLKKLVEDNVTRLTNGLQKPTSRNQTHGFDWVIW